MRDCIFAAVVGASRNPSWYLAISSGHVALPVVPEPMADSCSA